jgi:hypothetical protein
MHNHWTASFLRGESGDSDSAPEAQSLKGYREQLSAMREWFCFGVDLRAITPVSINDLDQQLRTILEGIYRLQHIHDISAYLISYDAVQHWVGRVLRNLYQVSMILEKPKPTRKDQEERFRLLSECPVLLAEVLEYFEV